MKLERTFRRLYTIPDVHGRLDLLDLALEKLDADGYDSKQDLLVFLGDFIDRGPDSKGVVDTLIRLRDADPETVIVLRGNHEDFPIDLYVLNKPQAHDAWYRNGGWNTEQSYPNGRMSEEHLRFLGSLPYSVECQGFFFSHAPVPRENRRNGSSAHDHTQACGLKRSPYNVYELTWHYVGPECEKPGAYMDVHEGPKSDNGEGDDFLIGLCGHIHRGPSAHDVRIFKQYRMLDSGAGCYPNSPLAVHECLSNRTFYARPQDLPVDQS